MLTIKRHFPINKLALSKAWYESKHFIGRVAPSIAGGFASLRERTNNMGKKSILSSLVLLVGFFGSLSALLILYPIATQDGGPFSDNATRANVESQSKSSTSGTWANGAPDSSGATQAEANGEVPAAQSQPIATSPVSPDPASSTPAPSQAPASSAAPLPVVSSPSVTAPTMTAPAPAATKPSTTTSPPPVTTAPTESAPSVPLPLPIDTAPVTNTVQGVTETVDGTVNGLLD